MQSIEYAIRALDKSVMEEKEREVRRREYDAPSLDDTDVDAGDEEVVRNKSGPMMGQGP
jgi:hypothetical protein